MEGPHFHFYANKEQHPILNITLSAREWVLHAVYCGIVVQNICMQTKVETIQNWGMRFILKFPWSTTGTELREKLGWTTLSHRRNLLALKTNAYKCIHKRGPTSLHKKFIKQSDMGNSRTRGASKLYLHRPRSVGTLLNTQALSYGTPYSCFSEGCYI